MTSTQNLLMRLRSDGVALSVAGERLQFDGPESAIGPGVQATIAKHKAGLVLLVTEAWWPDGRPVPNVMSLGTRFGAEATTAALATLGCDLAVRTPTWEELFVVALQLEGGAP
jgi:hypothetical protein